MLGTIGLIDISHTYKNVSRFRFNYMNYIIAVQRTVNQNRVIVVWSQKYNIIRILIQRSEVRRLERYFGYIGVGFLNTLYRLARRMIQNE